MAKPFLTANWADLLLINYVVPEKILAPYVPQGLALDTRDGQTFASLVAFVFKETKLYGVPVPFFGTFLEWNLRLYVRRGSERGVVFVREFIPPAIVSYAANILYNEPYAPARMDRKKRETPDDLHLEYYVNYRGTRHHLGVNAKAESKEVGEASDEHFFKEHKYGYGRTRSGKTIRYEVDHRRWRVFPVTGYSVGVDWAALYGKAWKPMQDADPHSVVLAEGSDVKVFPYQVLGKG